MRIIGIAGSLRRDSFNMRLLKNAQLLFPSDTVLDIIDIASIPLYNGDLDKETKPVAVQNILQEIGEADGLLIATPEYNYSIPGVLKNVLDWVSRPAYKSVLANKPVAIISASKGLAGGARAQAQLRHVLGATLSSVYPSREYLLPSVSKAFDGLGTLQDVQKEGLERYLLGFCNWVSQR